MTAHNVHSRCPHTVWNCSQNELALTDWLLQQSQTQWEYHNDDTVINHHNGDNDNDDNNNNTNLYINQNSYLNSNSNNHIDYCYTYRQFLLCPQGLALKSSPDAIALAGCECNSMPEDRHKSTAVDL